jgi:predicted DNA-binding transcriptional regulator YafY
LVVRGGATYLVATAYEYEDARLFALHRFESVSRNYEIAKVPKGFKLASYLDAGALQFGSGGVVRLVARIRDGLARHLEETPLAANQKLKAVEGGVQLIVSVPDTWQLHWWILSQGSSIVVLSPDVLRERIAKSLLDAAANYQNGIVE